MPSISTSIPLTILFADIAGSTRLYETLGNTEAQRIVSRTLQVLGEAAARNSGKTVKTIGDEIMCAFTTPDPAVRASMEMQQILRAGKDVALPDGRLLCVRIGFHHGLVIKEETDIFGDGVNVAARVVAAAKACQILTTMHTVELSSPELRKRTRLIDIATLKGKSEEFGLAEVVWEDRNVTVIDPAGREKRPGMQNRLLVRFREREFTLGTDRSVLTMGRDPTSDIVVENSLASRSHGKIEFRKDRFVVTDQSTNGTFILVYGEPEVSLRRDELALRGSGIISLGHAYDPALSESIHFSLEQ